MTDTQGSAHHARGAIDQDAAGQPLALEQALAILRRSWLALLLCVLLGGGGALLLSLRQEKRYTASAALVFDDAQISQQIAGLPASAGGEPKVQQDTNVKLLEIGRTAAQVARRLGPPFTAAAVRRSVSIAPQGESNVVDVEGTAASPRLAVRIANLYASRFVSGRLSEDHRYFAHAEALVSKQLRALSPSQRAGAQGLALQNRAQSLAILAQLRSGDVEVAQRASVPSGPSSPKTTRNVILGVVLGLLLGIGLVFLRERLDSRMKEPEDLEFAYSLPLLGVVPESDAYRRFAHGRLLPLPGSELEALRMLRAKLRYFNVDRDLKLVLITSAAAGDGKTTVTLGLAEAAASMGERVLIIEADLRKPTLAQALGLSHSPGLADAAIAASSLQEAAQPVRPISAQAAHVDRPHTASIPSSEASPDTSLATLSSTARRTIDVLVAGTGVPNPTGMLESKTIERVLAQAAATYDLVLIDTPPLSVVPDAIPLLGKVDGVVIVGRMEKNRKDHAQRLREELRSLRAPLLGVVANGLRTKHGPAYGYDYERTGEATANTDAASALQERLQANGNGSAEPVEAAVRRPA